MAVLTCNCCADGIVVVIIDPKQNLELLQHVKVLTAKTGKRVDSDLRSRSMGKAALVIHG